MQKLCHSIIVLLATSNIATATEQTTSYNWTGAYAGVNLGSIWTEANLTANQDNFVSESGTYNQKLNSTDVNPGFQFGYLQQLEHQIVVGAEADFSYPDTNSHFTSAYPAINAYDHFNVRNNLQGSMKLRMGYAIERFLPFISAGVSFASMGLHYENEELNSENTYSTSSTQTAWVLGGGLEYGVFDNLSVRTEYIYSDYGNALNMTIPDLTGVNDPAGAADANISTNVLRAAVNYRF